MGIPSPQKGGSSCQSGLVLVMEERGQPGEMEIPIENDKEFPNSEDKITKMDAEKKIAQMEAEAEAEESSKFFMKIMRFTFCLILIYMIRMICIFITLTWFANEMKSLLKDFFNFDTILYDLFQQIILIIYSVHKPIMYLNFKRKELKKIQVCRGKIAALCWTTKSQLLC